MATRVNLHAHSTFSDGSMNPEVLAERLARDGVKFAALTDHDSIDGLSRFEQAAHARGIGAINGIELTVEAPGRAMGEMHILGYGFDPTHPELISTLKSLHHNQSEDIHSIANTVRKGHYISRVVRAGKLPAEEAITLLHRAGGRAFLAHPLLFESDFEKLDASLRDLKGIGLDGIEALYVDFSHDQQARLCTLADKHGLLICAGTDVHNPNWPGMSFGFDMPRSDWVKFRQAVFSPPHGTSTIQNIQSGDRAKRVVARETKNDLFRRRYFILRILLPTTIAISLFLVVIWGLILPSFKSSLLERKRELIHELTNAAWSILASYEADERAGLLTRDEAQQRAKAQIESIRYGPDGKDYFWLQDETPRIIMHPYRPDLNGQDVSEFTDPNGIHIFVEFAKLVQRQGEGYLDYVWQWQDNPDRLEPKESYVLSFEPWNWIIGTGLYLDDVNAEIDRIESRLVNAALLISVIVIGLLAFVVYQSLRIEHQRREIEAGLRQSTERYYALVEATTEGTLLVLAGRCRYANPTFLKMVDYTLPQLDLLELEDMLPPGDINSLAWESIQKTIGGNFESRLKHADGHLLECLVVLNPIQFAGEDGWILLAKELSIWTSFTTGPVSGIAEIIEASPVGMFRARTDRRGTLIHVNDAARALIPLRNSHPALADLFIDESEFDQIVHQLETTGEISNHLIHVEWPNAATQYLTLSAHLTQQAPNHTPTIDGTLIDITIERKKEMERAALIDRLQTSLLFLHEPIGRLGRDALTCGLETSINELAHRMTARSATAALVVDDHARAIGIITDQDLRARVLAGNADLKAPVSTIMSTPITRISETGLIYEALMRMEEKGVQHLAVEDENGQIVSLVDNKSLIQFQRYGAIVLTREIGRSINTAEVTQRCQQAPPLIKALVDSGARPRQVTRILAGVSDAASNRLIELAIDEIGPPPSPFAFIAMGSQGRQEQTLLTDQDNGIIFDTSPGADDTTISTYFLKLGNIVNSGLSQAGYSLCRGGVMAGKERWCRSLAGWKSGFDEWIRKPEPQELIDFSIFFDLRTVYGNDELTHELRHYIHAELQYFPGFFPFFARNALTFKPPFRLLGNIYLGGDSDHAGYINLKDASMPIVSFARLYALYHHINQTHTLERIEALSEQGIILPASRDEITTAYDFLMRLRLHNQLNTLEQGRQIDNFIQPGKLGYIEQELLKQAFAQIVAVQKKVGYDFIGGG